MLGFELRVFTQSPNDLGVVPLWVLESPFPCGLMSTPAIDPALGRVGHSDVVSSPKERIPPTKKWDDAGSEQLAADPPAVGACRPRDVNPKP